MQLSPHPPGCLCSSCHLSSKLFPRGPNDRIILPAIRPGPGSSGHEQAQQSSKSPFNMGTDRPQFAPPRPQSTAPHEYRPRRQEPPPPVPALPRGYGEPSSSTSRGSLDTQRAPPPMHRPVPMHAHAQPTPERSYTAMAAPHSPNMQQQGQGQGNLEWMPPRLKWVKSVKKKERVSHFTPPSQYQGTSFREYVHDGVSSRPT
ncbi:hypothetical protein B0H13DRAFT_2046597 [Mycena leptocephala]|nr:hypothetical protein B0H13DRAFT_2046597 [Mycena leptocephala]